MHGWLSPSMWGLGALAPGWGKARQSVLPQFLDDFFPPQDVMNKVIGEFLSSPQPYPQFMATVVYQVRGRGRAPRPGAGPPAPPGWH